MSITLEGLTRQQYQIADMIWSCDSQEAVNRLLRNLPPEYRRDGETVYQLMIAAVLDDQAEIIEPVRDLIDRIRNG